MAGGIRHFLKEGVYNGGSALHFFPDGEGEMKEWTRGAPLFTFSVKEKARVSTLHFFNEGNDTGVPPFTFSMKEWTMGAPLFTFSMKEWTMGSLLFIF